jgi:hypothetical protein
LATSGSGFCFGQLILPDLPVLTSLFWRNYRREFEWGTQFPDLDDLGGWFIYITDIMFPLLCIWYFNKPSVKEFFRKVEKDV